MKKNADVVIIGGGIVGNSAAYYLAKRGIKNVIVLEESKSIGHGGSSRNGGESGSQAEMNVNFHMQYTVLKNSGLIYRKNLGWM